jgi:(R,R)-butanediol dehydrogenase/meso-butanediol dehydrogenase/diacetyl reductase
MSAHAQPVPAPAEDGEGMRAAVLRAAGSIVVEERPVPRPGPDEVLVTVAFCGICGSDLHVYLHAADRAGAVLGHECTGVVREVGSQVRTVEVGDCVVVRPSYVCDECEFCAVGDFRLCPHHFTRTIGVGAPGGFADAVLVKDYMAIPLPDGMDLGAATWVEPLACAVHAVRRAGVGLGDHVTVYGAGPIGLMVLAAARRAGATELVAFERVEVRRAAARLLGASVHSIEDLAAGTVPAWLRERGADVSFECTGVQAAVDAAIATTRPAGTVLFEALYGSPQEIDLTSAIPRELTLLCSIGSTSGEFQAAIDLIAGGEVDVNPFTTSVVGLDELDDAFRGLTQSTDLVKVLVTPGSPADQEVAG